MKRSLFSIVVLFFCLNNLSWGANLIEIYQQALISDPTYQQTISSRLATQEGVPISFASLLPQLSAGLNPYYSKQNTSGAAATLEAGSISNRGYITSLTLNQTIFDFSKIANLMGAKALSAQADASLSASTQDLMVRVSKAYFTLLQDEENLTYSKANKNWLRKLLEQVKQQQQVGVKTLTDVYATRAQYDTAYADYISALNQMNNDKENLRVITGKFYHYIAPLSGKFPLIKPNPTDIDQWVKKAIQQNWSLKAEKYAVENKMYNIKQQFSGHLPTLNLTGTYTNNYAYTSQSVSFEDQSSIHSSGPTRVVNKNIGVTMSFPLFSGGFVSANTEQARYHYQTEMQVLEQTYRNTVNLTRQSYFNVLAGVIRIKADKQAIKSASSALEGMHEGYRVGNKTIIDVLQQQQKLFEAQKTYSQDRFDYIVNILMLKQAAGILNQTDLEAINQWLIR